ncbi:hypothetical protein [Lonsdalea populi]|uniref:hypothetical protein n=1 Tax=Lonsdalea populi TaxID=1172565 RepID=UPI0015EC3534|nr:hypothetical protein [Lonsdalea populi]
MLIIYEQREIDKNSTIDVGVRMNIAVVYQKMDNINVHTFIEDCKQLRDAIKI